MKHKIRQQIFCFSTNKILCFITNHFNKHDFIENQAKLDFFDMLERSLKAKKLSKKLAHIQLPELQWVVPLSPN
jgi:hypothetical protein